MPKKAGPHISSTSRLTSSLPSHGVCNLCSSNPHHTIPSAQSSLAIHAGRRPRVSPAARTQETLSTNFTPGRRRVCPGLVWGFRGRRLSGVMGGPRQVKKVEKKALPLKDCRDYRLAGDRKACPPCGRVGCHHI